MKRKIIVAATQMACTWDLESNLKAAERIVRSAAASGANIILLQELFSAPYFCQDVDDKYFSLAEDVNASPTIKHFTALAKELAVVLPVSFFEKAGARYFNSLVVIDADGSIVHHYRKIHIPDAPGYYETYYFDSGDLGPCVADTAYGRIGVGVCWDQWFPEYARVLALGGAEVIFYPTAIGSEPANEKWDSRDHWRNVMCGHAGANLIPVVASNRIGEEAGASGSMTFYGSAFIADHQGKIVASAERSGEKICLAELDLAVAETERQAWGIFKTRQIKAYEPIVV